MVRKIFEPNIYLYDSYPGGVGLSEPLFRMSDSLLEKTHKLISECPCPTGCPSCVGPAGEIGEKGKEVALEILRCEGKLGNACHGSVAVRRCLKAVRLSQLASGNRRLRDKGLRMD